MGQKSQDNEAREQGRQVLLAVPVVVLEVVALGLQGVVVFVFDFPASAPGRDDRGHVAVVERQGGRKGVVVQHLAVHVGGGELAPVDRERVIGIAQGDGCRVAVSVRLAALAAPARAGHGADGAGTLQVRHPLGGDGMGLRLADQDEVESLGLHGAAKRLVAVEVIAEDDRLQPRTFLAVRDQPALGGIEFAVLLLRAVLWTDERRGQRNDFVTTRLDQHGGEGRVGIRHLAVGVLPGRTVRAMDRRRGEVLRPIEGEQHRAAHRAVGIHDACLLQGAEQVGKERLDGGGIGGVEQGADLVVRGDVVGPEQRPGVVFPPRLLQAAQIFQKRGALQGEHREGAQSRINHRVGCVLASPGVGKALKGTAHPLRHIVQGQDTAAKGCAHRGLPVRSYPAILPGNCQNKNCCRNISHTTWWHYFSYNNAEVNCPIEAPLNSPDAGVIISKGYCTRIGLHFMAASSRSRPRTTQNRRPNNHISAKNHISYTRADNDKGRTAILVLGMHRSGTSACTRTINLLGADLPTNLMPAQPGNNEVGFWESMDVYELNDEILASAGSSWDDWLAFNPDWMSGGEAVLFKKRALSILEQDFIDSSFFVLKDPRICRLLPFWQDVLTSFSSEIKCVIPIRNPLEVAASLMSRDGFSPVKSYAVWLRNMLAAERDSRTLRRSFLRYDVLLSDWRRTISRLTNELDLRWPRRSATTEVEIDNFLDGRHRHHALRDEEVLTHPELSIWVKDAFKAFIDLDAGKDLGEATHHLDRIRGEFDQACQMLGTLARAEEIARAQFESSAAIRVQQVEELTAQRDNRIAQLEDINCRLEEENRSLAKEAHQKDEYIANLIHDVKQHESNILDLKEKSVLLEAKIREQTSLADQRGVCIFELEAQVRELTSMSDQREARISRLESHVKDQANLGDRRASQISQLEANIREQTSLADQRAARVTRLEAQLKDQVSLGDRRASRISELEVIVREQSSLADQRAARISKLLAQLKDQTSLANQRAVRIGELEGLAYQADKRQAELQSKLQAIQEESNTLIQTNQALLFRLNAIQLSASWQLARPIHITERRWPRLISWFAAAEKFTWWTATAQLRKQMSLRQQAKMLLHQGLFDLGWYVQQNPDVVLQGFNPIMHWLIMGSQQVRNPNPLFDINWYLHQYSDVRQLGINPLLHYVQTGAAQGRLPHPLFDTRWYLERNPDVASSTLNPLAHYLRSHPSERRDPHPLFDADWYLQQHHDVEDAGENPLVHYLTWGAAAGRDPNPFFDSSWYLAQYPDVAKQGLNPLVHFVLWGSSQGWNPSSLFDTQWYLDQHPEIAAAHLNPLAHYLHTGIHQGWPSHPAPLPTPTKEYPVPPSKEPGPTDFQQKPAANANELEKVATLLYKQKTLFRNNQDPKRILIIDWKPPTPDRDSGSYRMSRILFCLRDAGYEVDFIGDRMPEAPQYLEQLGNRRIKVIIGREAAISHFAEQGNQYRLIILARPETFERYLPIARAFAPQAKVLYDTVDLHWVRFERSSVTRTNPHEANSLLDRSRRYKRLELANAQSADTTLAISEDEKLTLLNEIPNLNVAVLPNLHEIANWRVPFGDRQNLFFIGGFDHEPNIDAVLFFISEIMPLIRLEIPEIRFHIVGSNMPASIRDMATKNIVPVGYVEDVEPYFAQSRIFVAPLRHGAGMKGKVGQSLSYGLPVVTTQIGAEGIGLVDDEHALIRNSAEDFARAIISLYKDSVLWQRLSESGRELIRQRFSIEAVRNDLLRLVTES